MLCQIVGSFADRTGQHGFLDTGGSFTQLDVPGEVAEIRLHYRGDLIGFVTRLARRPGASMQG